MKDHRKSKLYQQVEQFVVDSFGTKHPSILHLRGTADWVLELKADAGEALLIAAVSHDIERAGKENPIPPSSASHFNFSDESFIGPHQKKGSEIIGEFLRNTGAEQQIIQKVQSLVLRHEVGGDDDQNLLKDADSLSFLENNIDHFLTSKIMKVGIESVKKKFDWMYQRITSPRARRMAEPFYLQAMSKVDRKVEKKSPGFINKPGG
ncbi:DUF4202 family protein [Thermodesulfobacteriota bacterium]